MDVSVDFLEGYDVVSAKRFDSGGQYAVLAKDGLTYIVFRFVQLQDYLDSKELHTKVMTSIDQHRTKFTMVVDVRGFAMDPAWTTHILDLCEFHRGMKGIYVRNLVCSNILMTCSPAITTALNAWLKLYQPLRPLHLVEGGDLASEVQKNIRKSAP